MAEDEKLTISEVLAEKLRDADLDDIIWGIVITVAAIALCISLVFAPNQGCSVHISDSPTTTSTTHPS